MAYLRKSKGSQREGAYEGLYQVLLLQQLTPGARLREIEWSNRLGVNRAALREALVRLETDGFVQRGASGGYCVPRLSSHEIMNILELRVVLEGGAVERICRLKKNTAEDLKRVQAACDELARLVDENDLAKVPEIDLRFHGAIVEASGNKRLIKIYGRAPLPLIYPEKYTKQEWLEQSAPKTLAQHCAILAAIVKGDVAGARDLLCQHLTMRYATVIGSVKRVKAEPSDQPAEQAQTDWTSDDSGLP